MFDPMTLFTESSAKTLPSFKARTSEPVDSANNIFDSVLKSHMQSHQSAYRSQHRTSSTSLSTHRDSVSNDPTNYRDNQSRDYRNSADVNTADNRAQERAVSDRRENISNRGDDKSHAELSDTQKAHLKDGNSALKKSTDDKYLNEESSDQDSNTSALDALMALLMSANGDVKADSKTSAEMSEKTSALEGVLSASGEMSIEDVSSEGLSENLDEIASDLDGVNKDSLLAALNPEGIEGVVDGESALVTGVTDSNNLTNTEVAIVADPSATSGSKNNVSVTDNANSEESMLLAEENLGTTSTAESDGLMSEDMTATDTGVTKILENSADLAPKEVHPENNSSNNSDELPADIGADLPVDVEADLSNGANSNDSDAESFVPQESSALKADSNNNNFSAVTANSSTNPVGETSSVRQSLATPRQAPTPPSPAQQLSAALNALRRMGDGSYSSSITLNPKDLGEVRLLVHVTNGVVNMQANALNPETRALLEANLGDLAEALADSGLESGSLDIGSGSSDNSDDSQQSSPRFGSRGEVIEVAEEDLAIPETNAEYIAAYGVNTLA